MKGFGFQKRRSQKIIEEEVEVVVAEGAAGAAEPAGEGPRARTRGTACCHPL